MTGLMTMMDVHTSHITEEAATFLQQEALLRSGALIVYEKGEYGWFLPVLADYDMATSFTCLNEVIAAARHRDCDWIMFDCDGAEWPELPTYEW